MSDHQSRTVKGELMEMFVEAATSGGTEILSVWLRVDVVQQTQLSETQSMELVNSSLFLCQSDTSASF